MSKIPVFVSRPTQLNDSQKQLFEIVENELCRLGVEPVTLGVTDYGKYYPLKEVAILARRCSGGLILGFEQMYVDNGKLKRGIKLDDPKKSVIQDARFPTPWNHLEAGILFGLKLPLLIYKENGIRGGVFDEGVTDAFVHTFPDLHEVGDQGVEPNDSNCDLTPMRQIMLKWYAEVSTFHNQF